MRVVAAFTHFFRCGGLAPDRLPRLCQRNSVAESRTSRQAECGAYFVGQFRLHDSQVAIRDRFVLWPPTRIARLTWLPSYEVGEATRVFSAPFFLCFFHCSH
jgi:hypothetical protein